MGHCLALCSDCSSPGIQLATDAWKDAAPSPPKLTATISPERLALLYSHQDSLAAVTKLAALLDADAISAYPPHEKLPSLVGTSSVSSEALWKVQFCKALQRLSRVSQKKRRLPGNCVLSTFSTAARPKLPNTADAVATLQQKCLIYHTGLLLASINLRFQNSSRLDAFESQLSQPQQHPLPTHDNLLIWPPLDTHLYSCPTTHPVFFKGFVAFLRNRARRGKESIASISPFSINMS